MAAGLSSRRRTAPLTAQFCCPNGSPDSRPPSQARTWLPPACIALTSNLLTDLHGLCTARIWVPVPCLPSSLSVCMIMKQLVKSLHLHKECSSMLCVACVQCSAHSASRRLHLSGISRGLERATRLRCCWDCKVQPQDVPGACCLCQPGVSVSDLTKQ